MTNQNIKRVAFACKYSELHPTKGIVSVKELNSGGTTLAWASRNSKKVVHEKILDVAKTNIVNLHNLVKKVATLPPSLRMVRLTSDMLSFYSHNDYQDFWQSTDVQNSLQRWFAPIGETARNNDVRLSFHPDQFCCIVSSSEGVVQNSLSELEYHADMMRWMGYGSTLLDTKINIHLSGRQGVDGFDSAWNQMSPELRNMLTLENDEFQSGLDTVLQLKNKVGIVLDVHHHWINTGEYIEASDDRIQRVIESWCRDGIQRRPVFHYSQSREDVLTNHDINTMPTLDTLMETGHKKAKLRAHSDAMWNIATNKWARQHWEWGDCMVEAKMKNLASFELYRQWS